MALWRGGRECVRRNQMLVMACFGVCLFCIATMTTFLSATLDLEQRASSQLEGLFLTQTIPPPIRSPSTTLTILTKKIPLQQQQMPKNTQTQTIPTPTLTPLTKPIAPKVLSGLFIQYTAPHRGQGVGNLVNGLLVALLLGRQYNRQVCVSWPSFQAAFDSEYTCPPIPASAPVLQLWNFGQSDRKATVDEVLSNTAHTVVRFNGNEYDEMGHWPSEAIPEFLESFHPNEALKKYLAPVPPATVVHLRVGDGPGDLRGRFLNDPAFFEHAVSCIGKEAYLLSDNDKMYEAFPTWTKPVWKRVAHSAGSADNNGKLRMWADWFQIVTAQSVFHTSSGFSESAIRISGRTSRRIKGLNAQGLMLEGETWKDIGDKWSCTNGAQTKLL